MMPPLLLLRLEPEERPQSEADEDSLMLGLFLDFLRCNAASWRTC